MSRLNDKYKNQFYLHIIVFIWGFTAILGELITINAVSLVWYRLAIASLTLFIFLKIKKIPLNERFSELIVFFLVGTVIAMHWVTFFHAIKISTISTTLIAMSSSAFFVVLVQPLFGVKQIAKHEVLLALLAILGFIIIFRVERVYTEGMLIALFSAFLISIFSVANGKLIKKYQASKIAFYELLSAGIFLSIVIFIKGEFSSSFFQLITMDWIYIFILAIICTAIPFVVATELLKKMSPYTIVLTNNLEPVYGIILAVIIFGDKEKMSWEFYLGAIIILSCVILNGLIKNNLLKLQFKK